MHLDGIGEIPSKCMKLLAKNKVRAFIVNDEGSKWLLANFDRGLLIAGRPLAYMRATDHFIKGTKKTTFPV